MARKFTFSLDHNLATGAIQLDPAAHPELLASLANNGKLRDGDNLIEGGDLQVAPGQNIKVGPGKVGFSADVNAALGIYSTPGNLRAAEILIRFRSRKPVTLRVGRSGKVPLTTRVGSQLRGDRH
jgi:hypothetical protein